MFDKIESILKRQLRVVNIKLAVRDKEYETEELARLLFTNQLKLNQFSKGENDINLLSNIDYDFSKILIDAFSDKLRLTGKGFVATVSEGILNQEFWQEFISRLVSMENKNKRDDYADFVIKLCRLYHQKFSELSENNTLSRGKLSNNMQKPFLDILRVVNSIDDKDTNKKIRDIIAFYFNNIHAEFTSYIDNNGDEEYARLATEYLDKSLSLDVYVIDKVDDESVGKWKLSDFTIFIKGLGSQIQKTAYTKRINKLVIESGIFDKEIDKLVRNLIDRLMLSQEPRLITENKLYSEIYEKLERNQDSRYDLGYILGFGMRNLAVNLNKNQQYIEENEHSSNFFCNLLHLEYILNEKGMDFNFFMEDDEHSNLSNLYQFILDGVGDDRATFVNQFKLITSKLGQSLMKLKSRFAADKVTLTNQTNNLTATEYSSIITNLRLLNIIPSKSSIPKQDRVDYQTLLLANPVLVQASSNIFTDLSNYTNDNHDYIKTVNDMYENWEYHSTLHRITERNNKSTKNFRVPYELGCSGLGSQFDNWMINNDLLYENLEENRDDVIILFNKFDLRSRIERLLQISSRLRKVINKNRSKTQRLSTLVKNLIKSTEDDDLLGAYSKLKSLNENDTSSKKHMFYLCVFGSERTVSFSLSRKGAVRVESKYIGGSEWADLLYQIGCDVKEEKINREESLLNLEQSIEEFTEILRILDEIEQSQVEQNEIELSIMIKQVESKVESLENKLIPTKEEQQNNVAESSLHDKEDNTSSKRTTPEGFKTFEELKTEAVESAKLLREAAEEKRIAEEKAAEDKEKHNQFDEESVYTHFKLSKKQWSSLSDEAKDGLIELFKNRKV